jgi:hypothetical protein
LSRFLTQPELFPARLAGETWGEEELTLDLPGGPFAIRGLSAVQRASLADRFDAGAGRPAYQLTIFRAAPSDFVAIDTRGWEYDLDIDGTAIAGMNLMARLGSDRGAIWTSAASRDDFWGVVENVLRPLVARRLLAGGGLLVHSAAVVLEGQAFLFAGASGAGKSTIAALALRAGHEVLSDDLNAVAGGAVVPLPFTGDLSPAVLRRSPAPLRAIVALEQGAHAGVRELSRGAAGALLARCAPYVNRDRSLGEALLDRVYQLARAARTCTLTFRRDGDEVWPILAAL